MANARTHVCATRLRYGHAEDLAAIGRLLERSTNLHQVPDLEELTRVAEHGALVVLPFEDDEMAAVACLSPGRGLVFLVVDPEVASPALEHRMIAVANALDLSVQAARARADLT